MRNCLELDYPADKLRILWVTDGSNDRTNERLSRWPQATVLHQPQRQGKTAALNRGIHFVGTPLVVFTDANTHLNRKALREIVHAFTDPKWDAWQAKNVLLCKVRTMLPLGEKGCTGNTNPPSKRSTHASIQQ